MEPSSCLTDRALIEPGLTAFCVCVEPRIEVKSVRSCSVLFFRRFLCDVIYLHYLIWLRFEETGKIMGEPTRKTVDPFRLFIQCKAGTFASEKNAFFPKRGKKDDLALVSSRQRA